MKTHVVAFQPPAHIPILSLQEKLYNQMQESPDAKAADPDIWDALKVKYEKYLVSTDSCRYTVLRKWDYDDHPDGPPEGEKNAKKLNTTLGTKSAKGESSPKQSVQGSKAPSSTHQQDFDAWVEVQEVDDDEVVSKEATLEFLAELKFLGKAKEPTTAESQRMKDLLDNMMRERCDIVEEYVYHLEQVKNYMENQIVWESREQKLIPQEPDKEALVFLSPQRNPNEPPRLLWNKDLFYLKNGNNEAKKYVLSLHKTHATSFLKDGLEKLLTIWVGKVLKKSNLEARLSNWKHIWTKLAYKKIHIKTRTGPKEVYSNSKIVKLMRVKNEDGYRQELMYEICVKRTDGKANENIKKERRVMNIHELQKFCDATLNRVLKRIEKVLLTANHGLKEPPLSKDDK
ncbi:hypothetical protein Tco_0503405 [Tanacetum coccineum]